MEAVSTSEPSDNFYITRCDIPEDGHIKVKITAYKLYFNCTLSLADKIKHSELNGGNNYSSFNFFINAICRSQTF
jgi:hypothetical protein